MKILAALTLCVSGNSFQREGEVCQKPADTLWGEPSTDCLGFGEDCQIDQNVAEQYQAYLWEPGKAENEKATWPTALAYCNSIGMDLATVADEDEYTNLREYVKQYHRCMKKGNVHTSTWWYIGLARDDVDSEFKWRYTLDSGESEQCHYENFGDGETYWGPNHPPGNSPGESLMNCVFMRAGTDIPENEAFFASRCDYNENSDIGFVCQQRRSESPCEKNESSTPVTLTSSTGEEPSGGDNGGNCKVPDPTLWGNPATDCLGFGEDCKIDKDLADQYQAYTREPGKPENEMPTWYTATDYCDSLGKDLATVADATEYDSLREYVMQYERCMSKGISTGTTFWYIGLARDHETAPFKWRYHLEETGESKHCPVEKFGDGRPYWGENNPPGSSTGDKERRCVYMRAGNEYDKNKAYFAARCDYNENSRTGFVCQKRRVKNRCGGSSTVFISIALALSLTLLFYKSSFRHIDLPNDSASSSIRTLENKSLETV